jgi:Domain of Unknown Function (DUF1543)
MHLYQILIGCTPSGRNIEQHDMFFAISDSIANCIPQMKIFWPEVAETMHVDGFRKVTNVDGFNVCIEPIASAIATECNLFFINLGGYKENEFEEFHYKMVIAAKNKSAAIKQAKETAFYKHTGFKGAESHIDDKYGIDVDDVHAIEDILHPSLKAKYKIVLQKQFSEVEDEINLGYFQLKKLEKKKG